MKAKCYNCKHAEKGFKIAGKTHHICGHPKWTQQGFDAGEFSAWDTLMEFWETCADHEINGKPKT